MPRWVLTSITFFYIATVFVLAIFLVPFPYQRYDGVTTCETEDIEYATLKNALNSTVYFANIHVLLRLRPDRSYNATLINMCRRNTKEQMEQCLLKLKNNFKCYYTLEKIPASNLKRYVSIENRKEYGEMQVKNPASYRLRHVATSDQVWNEYVSGRKNVIRVEAIILLTLCSILLAFALFYIIKWKKEASPESRQSVWRRLIYILRDNFIFQPVSGKEDDFFMFDEGESRSAASFVSTESYYTSSRKRQAHSLLSYTAKSSIPSFSSSGSAILRERVHYYYHPRPHNVLKSLDAGNMFFNLAVVMILSYVSLLAFAIFGIVFVPAHLVVFITAAWISFPAVVTILFIQSYANVFGAHYFLTEYRVIVLIELPLKLGLICYHKPYSQLKMAQVHQLYCNIPQQTIVVNMDETRETSEGTSNLEQNLHGNEENDPSSSSFMVDNDALLNIDLSVDDYEGAVSFVILGEEAEKNKAPASFHYVPNVDGVCEFIRRQIELSQHSNVTLTLENN